jgi:hypothetical protein
MNDFINSIEISSENLDFTKQKGLAEGKNPVPLVTNRKI